jgi:hypothetical protein
MCKALNLDGSPLGIVVTVPPGTNGVPILKGSADRAFTGVTVRYMKELIKHLEINPSPAPQTEHDCVKVLMYACHPSKSEAEILEIMSSQRHIKMPKFKTNLNMDAIDACGEVLGSSTTREMRDELKAYMKKVEAAKLVTPAAKPKAKAGAKTAKKKVWAPKDYETALAAQAFKPPHPECYLSLETEWHPRWKISYPCRFPPYCFSSPYDPDKPVTKRTGLFLALKWAWAEHEAQELGACPYVFET